MDSFLRVYVSFILFLIHNIRTANLFLHFLIYLFSLLFTCSFVFLIHILRKCLYIYALTNLITGLSNYLFIYSANVLPCLTLGSGVVESVDPVLVCSTFKFIYICLKSYLSTPHNGYCLESIMAVFSICS